MNSAVSVLDISHIISVHEAFGEKVSTVDTLDLDVRLLYLMACIMMVRDKCRNYDQHSSNTFASIGERAAATSATLFDTRTAINARRSRAVAAE